MRANRRFFAFLFLACSVSIGLAVPFIPVLELVDERNGRVVFRERIDPGEEFVLSFVHSVNKRPVHDTMRAEKDHLIIVKSCFDAFGAGMPDGTTDEGVLAVASDGRLEWTVNRPVPEVTVRVGRVAGHSLRIKQREIRLAELAEPGAPLTVHAGRARIFDVLQGRCP